MAGEPALFSGLRLAVSFFTVVPVPVRRVDRGVSGVAMALAPAVGAALGVTVGAAGLLLNWINAGQLLAAVVTVLLNVALTRGMHLDGLADTADGLGSYRGRERALEIMKQSDIGPFGVTAVVLALLLQVAAVANLVKISPVAALAGFAAAHAAGRVAATVACRRGVPSARETGLGALVAGTVARPIAVIAALGVAVLAVPATPHRPWQGPLAVCCGLAASVVLVRHATRRLGGVTGDVLGAGIEITETITLVGLALSPPY
jgi:adenosylcobinamide-GDP ribazoletransferase